MYSPLLNRWWGWEFGENCWEIFENNPGEGIKRV